MAFLTPYSARNVTISYAGIPLNQGRPEDVFFTVAENAQRMTPRKGLSGDTSVSLSSDHSTLVTLSFFPESDAAKVLTAIYYSLKEAERAGTPALGAAPLMVSDPSGITLLASPQAALQNKTETSFGADTGTISFEFYVEEALIKPLPADIAGQISAAKAALGVPSI